jgi:uridylate kinase
MDQTAFTLCKENKLPIRVLNMFDSGSLVKMLQGEKIGTLVTE